MRNPVFSDAFLTSSASCWSGMVGHSISSNPASRAIWKRSAMLTLLGSISNSTAFLIGSRADACAGFMAELMAATPAPAAKNVRLFIVYPLRESEPQPARYFHDVTLAFVVLVGRLQML